MARAGATPAGLSEAPHRHRRSPDRACPPRVAVASCAAAPGCRPPLRQADCARSGAPSQSPASRCDPAGRRPQLARITRWRRDAVTWPTLSTAPRTFVTRSRRAGRRAWRRIHGELYQASSTTERLAAHATDALRHTGNTLEICRSKTGADRRRKSWPGSASRPQCCYAAHLAESAEGQAKVT